MKEGTCVLRDVAILGDRNVVKNEAEKILKYEYLAIEKQRLWNWNHPRIIHKIPEQHVSKARNQGTAENSHIGHCQHTVESADIKE
jgi:hypothetical protein